jgi:hypothetical protein
LIKENLIKEDTAMIIKQLSVFLENKSGRLTEVTKAMADHHINISAFSIAETADYGILRMIVNKPEETEKMLKEAGFSVHRTDVICLIVPHKPGGLYRALQILSDSNISVEYMYAFAMADEASVVLRIDNIPQAIKVLQDHKLELKKASEIYQL